ncbi:hypothetical protein Tco_0809194 [Tanacetum coccineum]
MGTHQASLELGMITMSHIYWQRVSKRKKVTDPYSSKGTKVIFLMVQVYVDDIIFGLTKKELCIAFEKLMHEKFQMSSMRELTFLLGFTKIVKTQSTLTETQKPLLKDGSVCACARYQVNPKVSHLHDVKWIFRYLKGQPNLGLWYPTDSPFDLVAYTDSDYAGASLDRKSTTRGKAKKSVKLMMEKLFRMELELMMVTQSSAIPTDPHHTPTFIQPSTQPQKTQQPRKPKRKDTQVPQPSDPIENVVDEAVHKELGDSLVRAATTASSLEAEQDSGNINKTQSKATPNESSSLGTTSGGGPRCQETMGDTIAQTRVLDLEKTKTTQHNEIASLKRRVKRGLKKEKIRSRTHKLMRLYKCLICGGDKVESSDNEESLGKDASKQGRIAAIDADEEITLVNVQNVDEEMFDVNVLDGEEVFVAEQEVAIKDVTLIEIKTTKPKEKGVVIQELSESTTTISSQLSSQQSQDKGKGILIEPVKPIKKKDLIRLDEEVTLKLQAKFDEEERLASEKAKKEKEANIALIEKQWDDRQRLTADH